MQASLGNMTGEKLANRFIGVACEYAVAPEPQTWIHIPCLIALRNPADEQMIRQSTDPDDIEYHQRNWQIEIDDRIPEVLNTLFANAGVVADTVHHIGTAKHTYYFGAQVRADQISELQKNPEMRHCRIRPVRHADIAQTLHMRG